MRLVAPLLALLAVPLHATSVVLADTSDTVVPARGIDLVSISTNAGSVSIGPGPDSTITVRTVRTARAGSESADREMLDGFGMHVGREAGRLDIECGVPEDVEVDVGFDVLVPPGLALQCSVDSGSVAARAVDGRLRISVGTGAVSTAGTRGPLEVNCGNCAVAARGCRGAVDILVGDGPLDCTIADIVPDSPVELATVAGPVRLGLPASGNADLELTTGAGAIEVEGLDLEFYLEEPSLVRARLGAGGLPVNVSVGSGNISVVAAKEESQ